MRPPCALRGMADCVLAWLAHRSKVLFDAKQDATCASLYASAFLLNVQPACFEHCGGLHKSRLAWLGKILEMRLGTFSKAASIRSVGATKRHNVPAASLYDRHILA